MVNFGGLRISFQQRLDGGITHMGSYCLNKGLRESMTIIDIFDKNEK